ncbi:MAG: hypothetical protein LBI71_06825, partial [Enterobacteriaceae bacterium]|nr:hypothetical protein [Enterobacteriaceae bacterium]
FIFAFFRCPPRRVLAWRRSVVAHYREFFRADNPFFAFFFCSRFFSTKSANMSFFHSKNADIGSNLLLPIQNA